MSVHITEAPSGTIAHIELAGRFDTERATLLVHLAPTETTPGGVALGLLQAMGKDLRVTGGNTVRTDEHRTYAPMWAAAYGISTVALLDAQQMRPSTIQALLALLPEATSVHLVCEPGHEHSTKHRLHRAGIATESVDWDTWLTKYPQPLATASAIPPVADGYGLDHLPLTDFLTFRHACRELNTPERFSAIDGDYVRIYKAALTVVPDEAAVIDHLDRATATAATTAPMMVAIRATQSAFFARGHLLQAHPDRLLGALSCTRAPRPADPDWRVLRAYIRPERAATTVLYLLGVPANALTAVTVGDIQQAIGVTTVAGRPIPALAEPLLATQLARRVRENAERTDSYLNLRGDRRHLEILIDARRDLGLPIDGRNLRNDHTSNPTRVLNRLGLEVRSIQ